MSIVDSDEVVRACFILREYIHQNKDNKNALLDALPEMSNCVSLAKQFLERAD